MLIPADHSQGVATDDLSFEFFVSINLILAGESDFTSVDFGVTKKVPTHKAMGWIVRSSSLFLISCGAKVNVAGTILATHPRGSC